MESVSAKKIETEVKGGLQMGVSMKFTDLDQYLFGQGTNYEVYKKLGAHFSLEPAFSMLASLLASHISSFS